MEHKDRIVVILIGLLATGCAIAFGLDYSLIAESGLTLSSIVLAVYIAAIIGLINSDLANKMSKTVAPQRTDKTQLGVLTIYFKRASFCAISTIVISSVILLIPELDTTIKGVPLVLKAISTLGLLFFAENITFLGMIIRFMLNRQIWNQ